MKHQGIIAFSGASLLALTIFGISIKGNYIKNVQVSGDESISISDNTVESFADGSFFMTTNNGNKIKFEYSGVSISNSMLSFEAGGYILNPYTSDTFHNAISGMKTLSLNHNGNNGDLFVDYTWGDSLASHAPYYQRRNFTFPKTSSYSFLDERPNYICIKAKNAVTVNAINLGFSCIRGEEKGDNLKINSPAMLERFKTTVGWGTSYEDQVVELTADIDMSISYSSGINPIGDSLHPFKGSFEGNNHTISNLTILSGTKYRAMFGYAVDATIQNLKLDNIRVTASSEYNGGLVGAGSGLNIENVTIESGLVSSKQGTGGIIGIINNDGTRPTYISNCINKAKIIQNTTSNYGLLGGIFGETLGSLNRNLTVIGCKNYGEIIGNSASTANNGMVGGIGGLVRVVTSGITLEVSHCSNFGNITSNNGSVGGIIGRARTGYYYDNYCYNGSTVNNNGIATSNQIGTSSTSPSYAGRIIGIIENSPTISIYDDCDEDGASINAVSISTATELKNARTTINGASSTGSFYKLSNDIDLTGVTFGNPIGVSNAFSGVFDGCGHTIKGLTVSTSTQSGLFYNCDSTTCTVVKNINLEDVTSSATNNRASGLFGRAKGLFAYNCHVKSGTVSGGTGESGGVCGVALDNSHIRNCSNNASVTNAGSCVGGIVGYAYSNNVYIDHCVNNGSISSTKAYQADGARIGGILGSTYYAATSLQVKVSDCINNGNINCSNRNAGGIVGQLGSNSTSKTHTVSNCINNGSVISTEAGDNAQGIGGIVGSLGKASKGTNVISNQKIENCVNNGSISSSGSAIGGIAGLAFAYNAASATTAKSTIKNCSNYGTIDNTTATSAVGTGGIVGATNPDDGSSSLIEISDSVNLGLIKGISYVGGVIGLSRQSYAGSIISGCSNYGNVSGSSIMVGGVAGCTRINMSDCSCLKTALLSNKTTNNAPAYTLNAVSGNSGILGYIVSEVQRSSTVSNSSLLSYYFDAKSFRDVTVSEPVVTDESLSSFSSFAGNNISSAYSWPMLEKLNNGQYLLTSTSGYAVGNSISENAFTNWKTRTNSYGQDYVRDPLTHLDTEEKATSANFNPLVLPNGRIIIFYRTNTINYGGYRYSSLRALVSDDNLATTPTKYILFENYGNPSYGGGAYEPYGVVKGDKIYVYFACDIETSHYNNYGNDYSDYICARDSQDMLYQNILYFTIDISNNQFSVNNDVDFAIKATANYRRPGMPSIARLTDGSYAMVYEHCGSISSMNNYWMQIAISYSRDLINWTTPINFISPTKTGIKPSAGTYYLAGAPTVSLLPSGRIAVSYTTNEYYTGQEAIDFNNSPEAQWFRTVELATSSNIIKYGDTPSMTRLINVRTYGENISANYGRCTVLDNKLILMSNNTRIDNDNGAATRTRLTGIYFSIANLTLSY